MKLLAYILRLATTRIANLLYFMACGVVLALLAMMLYSLWC